MIKNTVWLTGGEIIGRLLRAGLVIAAARILGAANWGVFSYVLSLAAIFSTLTDLGLGAVLTRELVKNPEQKPSYLTTAAFLKFILIILMGAVIVFATPFFTKIEVPLTLIVIAALLVTADGLRSLLFSLNRALEKMHREALANILMQIFITFAGLFFLIKYSSLIILAWIYLGGSLLSLAVITFLLRSNLKLFFQKFDASLAKKIISASWPFALLGLLGGLMLNIDTIMLNWFRDATDIGYYSAAQKIIFVLYVFPSLIATAAFPSLTRFANKKQIKQFSDLLVQLLKIVFAAALPLTIGGLIIGQKLIVYLFGAEYSPAGTTFLILLLTIIINYPTTILGNALFAFNKQKEFLKYSLIGTISNIIFNLLFIPQWGIAGAAASTVITQIISNIFLWQKMRQISRFAIGGKLNKTLWASLIMGTITWMLSGLSINLFFIIAIAIAAYLIILTALKEPIIKIAIEMIGRKIM